MHPLSNEVLHWSSLPLWCHVADTVNRSEREMTSVMLNITLYFILMNPSRPLLMNFPIELLYPFASTKGWYGTICVAGEEEHLDVWLMIEDSIDPKRSLVLEMPVFINFWVTHLPGRIFV